ncbi:5615_t:CDS:2, partial [Acaulospora morrowiae]
SVNQLAKETRANEEKLVWLLCATSTSGIFRHLGDGVYANNRLSSVCEKVHPNS